LYAYSLFITYDCVFVNVAYKNFSYMDSNPLTGCIKHGILALVLKDITFIVCVIFMESSIFISKETMRILTVHFHILSLQLFDHRQSDPQHL